MDSIARTVGTYTKTTEQIATLAGATVRETEAELAALAAAGYVVRTADGWKIA